MLRTRIVLKRTEFDFSWKPLSWLEPLPPVSGQIPKVLTLNFIETIKFLICSLPNKCYQVKTETTNKQTQQRQNPDHAGLRILLIW